MSSSSEIVLSQEAENTDQTVKKQFTNNITDSLIWTSDDRRTLPAAFLMLEKIKAAFNITNGYC